MEDLIINKLKEIGIRLGTWAGVLGIILLISGLIKFITWGVTPYPELYVNYDAHNLSDFSAIEEVNVSEYNAIYNQSDNPSVVIDKPGLNKNGYKEFEKSIYSPLVLYVGELAKDVDSGFSVSDTDLVNSKIKIQKNLAVILEGIENNLKWQDIGINSKCLEGDIKLAVPDKFSVYREEVKNLFILNLSSDVISQENYEELSKRAEAILDKCIQVEDVKSYLAMNKSKKDVGKVALIAPEYIMTFDNDKIFTCACSDGEQKGFVPIYPTKTTAITYSLYVKEDIDEDLKENIMNSYNNSAVTSKTGFRNSNTNIDSMNGTNIVENIHIEYLDNIK